MTFPMPGFREVCRCRHNELRALHGLAPLQLSDYLNGSAQAWAEQLLKDGKFEHSKSGGTRPDKTGENLFASTSTDPEVAKSLSGATPVNAWYDEIKDFSWDLNEEVLMAKFSKIGHFTQIVWETTTHLG